MSKSRWRFGLSASQAPQDIAKPVPVLPTLASADAKKFGLENYCNNCYVNSVVQALYFCAPFRDLMLQSPDASLSQVSPTPSQPTTSDPTSPSPSTPARVKPERKPSTSSAAVETPLPLAPPIPPSPPSLFSALRSLFVYISTNPAERGTVSPRIFIDKLKELNRVFDNTTHQDAHEFLNYLLNRIVEEVEEEQKTPIQSEAPAEDLSNSVATLQSIPPTVDSNAGISSQHATLVHKLFEGALTSETRCLTCETVSSRDESFLDLSIDIEQNSSVTACLRQFSASEMLCHKNKFFCDSCCDLQEAEKRMKIKRLPNILALHLKRFKYQEDLQRYVKLAYRVAFPFELRLFNTVDELDDADRLYNLSGIVVHIGNGPHHGHYVSIIKTMGKWLLFDDDTVSPIAEADIPKYYGDSSAGAAYVLYYQAADIDSQKLGIRTEQNSSYIATASTTSHPMQASAHPPGLIPEDGPTPIQAHTSSSSSVSDSDRYTPPPQPSMPIIIPPKPTPPPQSMSASTSTSHSTASAPQSSPSPSSSPLASVLSSPLHSSSKVSVSNLIKTIRKSPSTSPRANVTNMGRATAPSAVASSSPSFPFNTLAPVPPLPGAISSDTGLVNGVTLEPSMASIAGASHSSTQVQSGMSRSNPNLGRDLRPATVHGRSGGPPRALPPQPRPNTGGQSEKEGTKKWFWRSGGHDPSPATASSSTGETAEATADVHVLGDVDPNTYANGGAILSGVSKKEQKDKERSRKGGAGTWFGKRKSFRIGEKALKGLVGSSHDSDMPTSSATSAYDDTSSFRNSLQFSTRREAGSMDAMRGPEQTVTPPPPADGSPSLGRSSSKHGSRPLPSTNLKRNLAAHEHTSINGDVSPPASSKSSLDQTFVVNSTPTTPVASTLPPAVPASPTSLRHSQSLANPLHFSQSRLHPLPRPPSHVVNGYPASSPPRLHTSASASPESPSVNTPTSSTRTPTSSSHTPTQSGFSHVRALPQAPKHSHERKKSLSDLPELRGAIEKDHSARRSTVTPLSSLRAPASAAQSSKTGDRPLPPVPGRTHHQRQGSLVDSVVVDEPVSVDGSGVGGHERSRTLHESPPPGLGSFGSANSSVGSNGSGNLGFRKATRKLSLTAPMLGFGKKDKTRERAAPSAFTQPI